jgi:hypothetical protein
MGLGDNLAIVYYYAADGDFSLVHGQLSFSEGIVHVSFVRIKHSRVLSNATAYLVNNRLDASGSQGNQLTFGINSVSFDNFKTYPGLEPPAPVLYHVVESRHNSQLL